MPADRPLVPLARSTVPESSELYSGKRRAAGAIRPAVLALLRCTMPVYEYRCAHCRQRSSHLFRTFASVAIPTCPHCGAAPEQMRKLVSRVNVMKSEESRLDDLADPSMFADVDENDPRSVAKWARKLGQQLGDDLPEDYGEMVDQLESGELGDEDAAGEGGAGGDEDF